MREIAPALPSLIYEIDARLHAAPGRALIIDYGYATARRRRHAAGAASATRNSIRSKRPAKPISPRMSISPRSHMLARACGPRRARAQSSQGDFLRALGIEFRARGAEHAPILSHAERLAARTQRA